ncbi:MAG: hypothetical protein LPK25_07780 [Cyclobacteriaceae bacterium]|nr:hypothetical protein [Cyclobacteriaceae bacterium]
MKTRGFPTAIAFAFLWLGFVGAISFMEAWLKFKAPGLDLATGLQIGRIVFKALNIVEWSIAIMIGVSLIRSGYLSKSVLFIFFTLIAVLLTQTFGLLPFLDERAMQFINGEQPGSSNLHFYYVSLEILKVLGLIIFSIQIHRSNERS